MTTVDSVALLAGAAAAGFNIVVLLYNVWRRIGTAQREILLASWEMRYWPHVLADMQKHGVEVTYSRRWE